MLTTMKGAVLGAALVAGTVFAAPANAGVHVGIGIAVPGPVYADPCYGPYPYPNYCAYPVFYGPIFYAGRWHNGAHRFRVVNGHRVFWHGGGWHNVRVGRGRFGNPHHGPHGGGHGGHNGHNGGHHGGHGGHNGGHNGGGHHGHGHN